METTTSRKSCLIIAPTETPLAPLLESLRDHRVDPFFLSDFLISNRLRISQFRNAVRAADAVVAILIGQDTPSEVYFEIGLAAGIGRPLLILSQPGIELPKAFAGLEVRYFDSFETDTLVEKIQSFIEQRQGQTGLDAYSESRGANKAESKRPSAALRNSWISSIKKIGPHDPDALERQLSGLFSDLGWTVAKARPNMKKNAPDLAIWIDEVQKDVGTPIAVEIKSSLESRDLNSVVNQLNAYLASAGSNAGLVLYFGPELELGSNVVQSSPPILAFSINELASLVEQERFPAALRKSLAHAKRMG